eukprot:191953_1
MRCMFNGIDEYGYSALTIYGKGALSIVECVFDNCGGEENDPMILIDEEHSLSVDLKMIGNVFKNLNSSPIGGECSNRIKVREDVILKQNVIDDDRDILYYFLDM